MGGPGGGAVKMRGRIEGGAGPAAAAGLHEAVTSPGAPTKQNFSLPMEQMKCHQHSHLSPPDGPKDQFAEISSQASFCSAWTGRVAGAASEGGGSVDKQANGFHAFIS